MNQENMKMTEVGWIPKDWEVKTLDEVGTFSKGRGVSRDQSHSGKLSCIRYGELYTSHENYIRAFYSFISQDVADTAKRLNKGDVLFAASGETKEEIGKTVAFVGTEEAYAGGDIIILSPKIESNSMFLGFVLNGEGAVRQKSALGQGDAVVHIHAPELARVCIPFPSNQEQSRIAEVLSDTDSLISSLSRTIEKKRLVKQGAMQQLLTGKTRLKGFCEEWVEMELREVCQITMGQSPDSRYYNTSKQGLPLIQGNADIEKRKSIDRIYTTQITKTCDTGDIIMSVRAPVGAVGIATRTSCIGRGACAMKCRNRFVYQWLMYQEDKWSSLSTGSTFDSINSDTLNKVRLMIPIDENEQIAIANILTTMDDEIAALEAERDKYISIKQGMMQKLLTGEIRLPICQTTE